MTAPSAPDQATAGQQLTAEDAWASETSPRQRSGRNCEVCIAHLETE